MVPKRIPRTLLLERVKQVLAITLGVALLAQSVSAQSPTTQPDTLRSMMLGTSANAQAVEDRLDALIETTKRARQERQAAAAQVADQPTHTPDPVATPAPAALPQSNSARSMSEIRERIRILQKIRRDRRISEATQISNSLPGGVQAPELSPPAGDVVPPQDTGVNAPEANDTEAILATIDQSLVPEAVQEMASEISGTKPSVAAERIMPKPVNSLALGESLYRTRNFPAALKVLKTVDSSGLSQSDRTWLDLLIALCQRRTGEYEAAEGTLRDIANEESSDYPVKAAKWWLKQAQASQETLTKMKTLSAEYDSLLERSKKHVNP